MVLVMFIMKLLLMATLLMLL